MYCDQKKNYSGVGLVADPDFVPEFRGFELILAGIDLQVLEAAEGISNRAIESKTKKYHK